MIIYQHIKYYLLLIFIFLSIPISLFSQGANHIRLESHVQTTERGSSIWGFTDPNGAEYAILGTELGVRIYSLANPKEPVEIYFVPCTNSIWRELKTSGLYCYVVTEASDGLLIIDLTQAPHSFTHKFISNFQDSLGLEHTVTSAHTIFIDEKKYIYLAGARPNGSGCVILDGAKNPMNPEWVHSINETYFHEVYAKDDLLYGADLYRGVFSIRDITDRKNPIILGEQLTAKNFTHAVWLEDDRKILYTADEINGAVVEAWEVTSPSNIKKLDQYKVPTPWNQKSIPHNVFHYNEKLYVAYYTEGVRILDTQDPENLIEVAYYDTYPGIQEGYHGNWSIYPFYRDGLLAASDIEGGLFILRYDQNQPAPIHLTVVYKTTREKIFNAEVLVSIDSISVTDYTPIDGTLKMGLSEEGLAKLSVNKIGFAPYTQDITIEKGTTTFFEVELEELPKFSTKVHVRSKSTNQLLTNVELKMYNAKSQYFTKTNAIGEAEFQNIYQGNWNIVVGKWGYLHDSIANIQIDGPNTYTLHLEEGYQDDFLFDFGWSQMNDTRNVLFIRNNFKELDPPPSNYPSEDVSNDIGEDAYYTNNFELSDPNWSIAGSLQLISPPMDLRSYEEITLSYQAWAYGGSDQSVKSVYLFSDADTLLLENVPYTLTGKFNPVSEFTFTNSFQNKEQVRLVFNLMNPKDSAFQFINLRAAFDAFLLKGIKIVGDNKPNEHFKEIKIQPVPVQDYLEIGNLGATDSHLEIINIHGISLATLHLKTQQIKILNTQNWPNGWYCVRARNQSTKRIPFYKL